MEHIAWRLRLDPVRTESLAQPRDVSLKSAARRLRRLVAPHLVDQPLGRHHPVRLEDEQRQDESLLGST
jgi:hypothetical protein